VAVVDDRADRLLRLPLDAGMTDDDIDLVIRAVESYRPVRRLPRPSLPCPQ
jgi:dTDP-4-amino-4,6-dideoxygalactose transaminase